jgi:ABC-2 type transport system permease protein
MWSLLKKDFKLLFSFRRTLFFLVLCLVVFFAMTFIYKDASLQQGILDQVKVGLVDEENSTFSRVLLQNFKNNEAFSKLFTVIDGPSEALLEQFNKNELTAIVYIPAGFTKSLLHYENTPIRLLLNPHNPLKNQVLVATLSSFSEYIASVDSATYSAWEVLNTRLPKEKVIRMNELYSIEMIGFALNRQQFFDFKPITTIPSASPEVYFLLSILIILSSFLSLQAALQLNSELEWRCLQRFLTTPQIRFSYMISKLAIVILHNGLLMIFLGIVISIFTQNTFIPYIGFLVTTLLTFSAFSLFMGALLKGRDLLLNVLSLLFLLFAIIGGNFIPLQLMPESIQWIARMTPNYWLIKFGLFSVQGFPLAWSSAAYLLIFSGFFLIATPILLFKKGAIQ